MRKYKMISSGLLESYRKYFIRNCKKWISRYTFTENDLGVRVKVEASTYYLEGQCTDRNFLIRNEKNEYFSCPGNIIEKID
jgi:hypothetical protein